MFLIAYQIQNIRYKKDPGKNCVGSLYPSKLTWNCPCANEICVAKSVISLVGANTFLPSAVIANICAILCTLSPRNFPVEQDSKIMGASRSNFVVISLKRGASLVCKFLFFPVEQLADSWSSKTIWSGVPWARIHKAFMRFPLSFKICNLWLIWGTLSLTDKDIIEYPDCSSNLLNFSGLTIPVSRLSVAPFKMTIISRCCSVKLRLSCT